MGMFIFFVIVAFGVALVLRGVIQTFTQNLHPLAVLSWQNILLALLRAFPYAFAFAPYLLVKRGLGVLIPASFYLIPATYEKLFGHRTLDAEDNRNYASAALVFFLIWATIAFIFFVRQSSAIAKKGKDEH